MRLGGGVAEICSRFSVRVFGDSAVPKSILICILSQKDSLSGHSFLLRIHQPRLRSVIHELLILKIHSNIPHYA